MSPTLRVPTRLLLCIYVASLTACTGPLTASTPPATRSATATPLAGGTPPTIAAAEVTSTQEHVAAPTASSSPMPKPSFNPRGEILVGMRGQAGHAGSDITRIILHCGNVLSDCETESSWVTDTQGSGAFNTQFSWSPPQDSLAFVSDRGKDRKLDYDIYLAQWQGTGLRRLTDDPATEEWFPAWSPSGESIAFASYLSDDGSSSIKLLDLGQNRLHTLAESGRKNTLPSWSPDGSRIAFLASGSTEGNLAFLYTMDATGQNPIQLTSDPIALDYQYPPLWSPDGQEVLFTGRSGARTGIYAIAADGSRLLNLTEDLPDSYTPAWSPDGAMIAFSSNTGEAQDTASGLFLINRDGTALRTLLTSENGVGYPVWSPDGHFIAYQSINLASGARDLHLVDVHSGEVIPLTDNGAIDGSRYVWVHRDAD